jgi:branched-chain amino acid transport system ATP-binding protein
VRCGSRHTRGFVIVNQVDLQVQRVHIHGLIGPNGAGKTNFLNLITVLMLRPAGLFGQEA